MQPSTSAPAVPARVGRIPASRTQQRQKGVISPRAQRPITSKDDDLIRWYADAVHAAELEHGRAVEGPDGDQPATPGSLGQELSKRAQVWLDERLIDVGFEHRTFPHLRPLETTGTSISGGEPTPDLWSQEEEDWGHDTIGGVTTSSRPRTEGNRASEEHGSERPDLTTTRAFVQWAQEADGRLPLLANQWTHEAHSWAADASGVLLQEAHAAHEWGGAADEHARCMIEMYETFCRDVLALPVIAGRRSWRGTMRGAATSYTAEALLPGGHALQVAVSHYLADNYSTLDSCHDDYDTCGGTLLYPFNQMGCGLSSGALRAAVVAHGDDAGIRLPPALAPVQVQIIPVVKGGSRCDRDALNSEAERIRAVLEKAGLRAAVDSRSCVPGVKFGASERRGIPLRIQFDPSGVASRTATISRRSDPGPNGFKLTGASTDPDTLVAAVTDLLDDDQREMARAAEYALQSEVVDVTSYYEFKDVIESGRWARCPWAGSSDDEAAVYEDVGATLRCVPLVQPLSVSSGYTTCIYSGYQATQVAVFARAMPNHPLQHTLAR